MRRRCCCKERPCVASFDVLNIGGNTWQFTDTSEGPHTRVWTSEDGGTSTAAVWTHTFPTDRMYWVELKITRPDGTECMIRRYVGDSNLCSYCDPNLLGETVYVTIPSVTPGAQSSCANIRNAVPGTWALDNILSITGCIWGPTTHILGQCLRCLNPAGDFGNHVLTGTASISPTTTQVSIDCELSVGPSSVSSECGTVPTGGSARYRKLITKDANGKVKCTGSHTLIKVDEDIAPAYLRWPASITLLIPG